AIYTHFASAENVSDPFTELQIASFDRMIGELRAAGVDAPLHHLANSPATMRHLVRPDDFVRIGIALFQLTPIMRWRTEIARLKELPPGHTVGYGGTFRTTRTSRIAGLPVGYAD